MMAELPERTPVHELSVDGGAVLLAGPGQVRVLKVWTEWTGSYITGYVLDLRVDPPADPRIAFDPPARRGRAALPVSGIARVSVRHDATVVVIQASAHPETSTKIN